MHSPIALCIFIATALLFIVPLLMRRRNLQRDGWDGGEMNAATALTSGPIVHNTSSAGQGKIDA